MQISAQTVPCELSPMDPKGTLSVLLVDDDPIAAEELAESLEDEGFRCYTATSSDQAMAAIGENPDICAIVTDFYLRGAHDTGDNGLALIDAVRDAFPSRQIDFLVVSGDTNVLSDCTIDGEKFLAKPIAPESLRTVLNHETVSRGVPEDEVPLVTLQRLLEAQTNAVSTLTEALTTARKDRREAASRVDRLVQAAKIASKRSKNSGYADLNSLIGFIALQGSAVSKLLDCDLSAEGTVATNMISTPTETDNDVE